MKKLLLSLLFIFFPLFVLATGTININTSSPTQLDKITGVGPVLAQRIIDARPFSSVDDLLRVKGIGPATLQKIKNQGLACVNCDTQAPAQSPLGIAAGSPAGSNSEVVNNTTPFKTPATEPIVTPGAYLRGIIINELLPNPRGADGTDEWIELYNSNDYDINLSGWQLQDKAGTIITYTIGQNTTITAQEYKLFTRPDTNIMLNNDGDGINLMTPDKNIIDSIDFLSAPLGQSYNKTTGGPLGSWVWSTSLTPGTKNIITAIKSTSASKPLSNTKNSVKNNDINPGLADISQSINLNQDNNKIMSPWFLFFAALAATIVSAIFVLIIKLRFRKITPKV